MKESTFRAHKPAPKRLKPMSAVVTILPVVVRREPVMAVGIRSLILELEDV
jgi:hypothetical protein